VSGRAALGVGAAAGVAVAARRAFASPQLPSWPPPADAVTPEGAEAATSEFARRARVVPRDAALPFAWSTAATLDPWVDGVEFFPRILADLEAAQSSIHILMFGWKAGEIGMRFADLLERKLGDGVEVRILVDGLGSRPYGASKEMYTRLARAGAQIVVNDPLPPARLGLYPDGARIDWRTSEFGRADHRKLYVVDGHLAWTGGAGIEDHFNNGEFHDVMVRVSGDVVRQAQAAFLTSFRGQGGPLPADLSHLFPAPADAGSVRIALAQVIPGGFVAASQAIAEQIESATERLDVINPYLTDSRMFDRIVDAARRGARVRVVVAEKSNNPQASAALRYGYAKLADAGGEVWEVPDTVVHAKVVVADDTVSFGTVNLDAWALYRNSELMMLARSPEAVALFEERLFDPDVARSKPGTPAAGFARRCEGWVCDKLRFYL
jgi:cardiolipin synthase